MLSFFPRGVSDEILNLIESVSKEFPSYSLNFKVKDLTLRFTVRSKGLYCNSLYGELLYNETLAKISITFFSVYLHQ